MAKIFLEMEKCYDCPFCVGTRTPTMDSWEHAMDYTCKETGRKIAGYVEWDHEMPEVPDWCPRRILDDTVPSIKRGEE